MTRQQAANVLQAGSAPQGSSDSDVLAAAVARARFAPSVHNTQPWSWRITDATAELRADRSRGLAVLDPTGRELVMSCGAALFQLRAALVAAGRTPRIQEFPEQAEPDLLARVTLDGTDDGRLDHHTALELDAVAEHRRTNRTGLHGDVPESVVEILRGACEAEHAVLVPVTSLPDRTLVKVWQQVANASQTADPRYQQELHTWVGRDRSVDGIPLEGMTQTAGPAHDLAPRDFAQGSDAEQAPVPDSPGALLAIVATIGDEPTAWLHAGQALDRIWLEATLAGVALQPLSQSTEHDASRMNLRAELRLGSFWPQLILRGGYAAQQPATPRRPLADILTRD
jgi:nitroreductase